MRGGVESYVDDIEYYIYTIFFSVAAASWMQRIWNEMLPSAYVSVSYDAARGYFSRDPDGLIRYNRYEGVVQLMACDWTGFFSYFSGTKEDCICVRTDCCGPADIECINESSLSVRDLLVLGTNTTFDNTHIKSLSRRVNEEEYPWDYGPDSGIYYSITVSTPNPTTTNEQRS